MTNLWLFSFCPWNSNGNFPRIVICVNDMSGRCVPDRKAKGLEEMKQRKKRRTEEEHAPWKGAASEVQRGAGRWLAAVRWQWESVAKKWLARLRQRVADNGCLTAPWLPRRRRQCVRALRCKWRCTQRDLRFFSVHSRSANATDQRQCSDLCSSLTAHRSRLIIFVLLVTLVPDQCVSCDSICFFFVTCLYSNGNQMSSVGFCCLINKEVNSWNKKKHVRD